MGSMNQKRYSAVSLAYNKSLWILGGLNEEVSDSNNTRMLYGRQRNVLSSSEFILESGVSTAGPSLPIPIADSAICMINSSMSILVGGTTLGTTLDTYQTDQSWYYNHEIEKFTDGPKLKIGRLGHSVGQITDSVTNEKTIIVVGGFSYNESPRNLDSTELLVNGKWEQGNIPND